ncbi:MAG: arginine deiminase-related protein [Pirellulaceae bacterium]|jgi:N-dimethylarginine dimethylaminohydrolase|nr:arginine deiminase-related protein [Pirellulaceae bacterium]MDP7019012.1 arginine deiminase-related protein [Pirellulaceae bacterium]
MVDQQAHILMCSPDYYGIEYEINPWMDCARGADHATAIDQWSKLHALLQSLGARISLVDPVEGLPDLVFTANAAAVLGDQAVLSRFRFEQRQGEEVYFQRRLSELGFAVLTLDESEFFEGAGDALFCGDTLFAGYRIRSDAQAHQRVGELLGRRVIPMELVDDYFYHLDTCFCPLTPTTALYYPGAFDDYARRALAEHIETLVEVGATEARRFACNAVVVGDHVVTNVGCPRMHEQLRRGGFHPHETSLSEFVKAGGSAKCLTLRLDGEESTRPA